MLFVEHLGRSHPEQTVRIVEVERAGDTENHLTGGVRTELTYRLSTASVT